MDDRDYFLSKIQEDIDADRERCAKHGWDFKERSKECHTIGDLMGSILAIDNDEDARRYYLGYVAWLSGLDELSGTPQHIARSNIGWCYGEGMRQERIEMWARVCGAAHPVFGAMTAGDHPTAEEAFTAGLKQGMQQ